MNLLLYQETNKGKYLTLTGAGIIIDLLHRAIKQAGADPSQVVVRIHDGSLGATIDMMYPTPHTYLFERVQIYQGELTFYLGGAANNPELVKVPLANPDIVEEIVNIINIRAKNHRKTRSAIKNS